MIKTIRCSPLHSFVVISDPIGSTIPKELTDIVTATESCILVCCYPEGDGETEFTLGETSEVDPGRPPTFCGQLLTPSRKVIVHTTEFKTILEASTAQTTTPVRIWARDPEQPEKVIIGLD